MSEKRVFEKYKDVTEQLVDKGTEFLLTSLLPDAAMRIVEVRDPSFYRQVLLHGSMGLGDSYVKGQWESQQIDEVIFQILSTGIYQRLAPLYGIMGEVKRRLVNLQTLDRAKDVIETHYDLPAEFYSAFLGPMMKYTCLDFTDATDIGVAEIQSMRKVCEKLELQPGQKVLDIGGGWGGSANFMAENYGVIPTVVTLSKEQAKYIRAKFGDGVKVLECDYREIPDSFSGSFDAISAIGVLEHIGQKNYDEFFSITARNLREGGRLLTHTLYTPYSAVASNPWSNKYIFPNGEIAPKLMIENSLSRCFEFDSDSSHPHFEDISPHYPPTLHSWNDRLKRAKDRGELNISEQEYRKFVFYFMMYAGAIRAGHVRVGQFLRRKRCFPENNNNIDIPSIKSIITNLT